MWGGILVLAIFESGVDSRLDRLFGGACVLPLGFIPALHARLHVQARRTPTVHLDVHTGLTGHAGPLWWAGSVPNGANSRQAREHLYPDGVAIEFRWSRASDPAVEVQNVRRDPRTPGRRRWGVDVEVGLRIRAFVLVRAPFAEVVRGAKDSLAPMGIGAAWLSVRLEHGSTVRQSAEGPLWTDARPLWTPPGIRGTVVRCLN